MWLVLMNKSVIFNVRLRPAKSLHDGAVTIKAGKSFAALEPTRGGGIYVAGASEIG
jgi:hypothetical protein